MRLFLILRITVHRFLMGINLTLTKMVLVMFVTMHTVKWRRGDRVLLCLRSNDKLLPLLLGFV